MVITELQPIIDALNKKKYAQRSGLSTVDKTDLTEEEQTVIDTYRPDQSLIIYGTLAPGRPNHYVVEPIQSTWQQGTVSGKLENKGWGAELGYFGFTPTHQDQVAIAVYVLFSTELAAHWPRLDGFEGAGYQRILAPFVLADGRVGVGHIYALHETS